MDSNLTPIKEEKEESRESRNKVSSFNIAGQA